MRMYLLGLFTLPIAYVVLWLTVFAFNVSWATSRDLCKPWKLKPGLRRWRWAYAWPMLAWYILRCQVQAQWRGNTTEISPSR